MPRVCQWCPVGSAECRRRLEGWSRLCKVPEYAQGHGDVGKLVYKPSWHQWFHWAVPSPSVIPLALKDGEKRLVF